MSNNVRHYKIMLGGPNDTEEKLKVIENAINEWNKRYTDVFKVQFNFLSGKSAAPLLMKDTDGQEVINDQVIPNCDMMLALFWTRLGSPTQRAESGTLEEIEQFLNAKKRVLLYFSESVILPTGIDSKQFKNVLAFKKEIEEKRLGLHATVKTDDELRDKVIDDLLTLVKTDFLKHKEQNNMSELSCPIALTLNSSDTIRIQLPTLDKDKNQKLANLSLPLNEEVASGCLPPDSFALFERDAKWILQNNIPKPLQGYMNTDTVRDALKVFNRHITNEATLQTYLQYWRLSFFVDSSEPVMCKLENHAPYALHDVSAYIEKPKSAYFITSEEKEFLENLQKFPIANPLQTARKESLLTLGYVVTRTPLCKSLSSISPSSSEIKTKKGGVIIYKKDIPPKYDEEFPPIYVIPLKKGSEKITVIYGFEQRKTSGEIVVEVT